MARRTLVMWLVSGSPRPFCIAFCFDTLYDYDNGSLGF